jgi:flagellin-like hook-associated protein FlgL
MVSINTDFANTGNRIVLLAAGSQNTSSQSVSSSRSLATIASDLKKLQEASRTSVNFDAVKSGLLDNSNNTRSFLAVTKTAESSLQNLNTTLSRIKENIELAKSSSLSTTQRGFIQQTINGLLDDVDDIASNTRFGTLNLLNGNLQSGDSGDDEGAASDTPSAFLAANAAVSSAVSAIERGSTIGEIEYSIETIRLKVTTGRDGAVEFSDEKGNPYDYEFNLEEYNQNGFNYLETGYLYLKGLS